MCVCVGGSLSSEETRRSARRTWTGMCVSVTQIPPGCETYDLQGTLLRRTKCKGRSEPGPSAPSPVPSHESSSEGLVWDMHTWWGLEDSAGLDWAQVR